MKLLKPLALIVVLSVVDSVLGQCNPPMCVPSGYSCKDLSSKRHFEKVTDSNKCDYVNSKGEVLKNRGSHSALCCTSEEGYNSYMQVEELKNQARALYGASDNEYPHQVCFKSEGTCGGTVYNKNWIITAAHCVEVDGKLFVEENGDISGSNPPEKAYVIAGLSHIRAAPESNKYYIDKIVRHPYWNPNNIGNGSDIAMLHLSRSLPLELGKIQPMRLESTDYIPPWGGKGVVIGFGNVNPALGLASDDLMEGTGPIHSNAKATGLSMDPLNKGEGSGGTAPKRSQLSIGGEDSGITVGQGDSGGPFICPDENNKPVLCGIASFKTCEPFKICRRPSFFTRVKSHLEFIKKATGNEAQEADLFFDKPMFPTQIPEEEAPGYLVRIGGNERSCTGALISSRLILTSAECIVANGAGFAPPIYHVKTGTELRLFAPLKGNRFERDISANFSNYMKQNLNKFDLGAIFINEEYQGETAKLAPEGYQLKGETEEYSFNPLTNFVEKRTFVPLTEDDCTRRIKGVDSKVKVDSNEQLCMRQVYSAEAVCERDIGGPLMCEGGKYLCGVKSFQACKYPGMPEIFERTAGKLNRRTIDMFIGSTPKLNG